MRGKKGENDSRRRPRRPSPTRVRKPGVRRETLPSAPGRKGRSSREDICHLSLKSGERESKGYLGYYLNGIAEGGGGGMRKKERKRRTSRAVLTDLWVRRAFVEKEKDLRSRVSPRHLVATPLEKGGKRGKATSDTAISRSG